MFGKKHNCDDVSEKEGWKSVETSLRKYFWKLEPKNWPAGQSDPVCSWKADAYCKSINGIKKFINVFCQKRNLQLGMKNSGWTASIRMFRSESLERKREKELVLLGAIHRSGKRAVDRMHARWRATIVASTKLHTYTYLCVYALKDYVMADVRTLAVKTSEKRGYY